MVPLSAKAQSTLGFDTVDVSVRPEYDTPTVLVIEMITLAPKTTLPADIVLRLPASVAKMYVVAVGASQDTVSDQNVEYKLAPGSDYARLSIKATALTIRLEYYDSTLLKTGNKRQYVYQWLGDYSVDKFRFELRQPLQSSNLSVEPALASIGLDEEGLSTSEFKQVGVKQDQKLDFTIKYQRETDSPSTAFLKVQPSTPLDQNVAGQTSWTTFLPWILGGLGLVLLLIAGWMYWASRSANQEAAARSRKRHVVRNEKESETGENQAHCSQCGKRAQAGDRFCRVCGARIRRDEA